MAFLKPLLHNINMLDGILLVDKEEGVTSRKVDNFFQRKFHTRKVGHLGTLDPFATGLFVVSINKGCKSLPFLNDEKKAYVAHLRLGYHSTTGDKDGEIKEGKKAKGLSEERIKAVFASFLGKGKQIPPMTSAIKIEGKPLYQLAHQGKEIDRLPRDIEIFSLDLLSFSEEEIVFECEVSKGTYIRVLGEDIAKSLDSDGYLISLRRTKIGSFSVIYSKKAEEIEEKDIIDPIDWIDLPHYELTKSQLFEVTNGKKIHFPCQEEKLLLIHEGKSIAVYQKIGVEYYEPLRGLF